MVALGSRARLARRKPSLTERTVLIIGVAEASVLTEPRFDWFTFVVAQLVTSKRIVRCAMCWIGFNRMISLQSLIVDCYWLGVSKAYGTTRISSFLRRISILEHLDLINSVSESPLSPNSLCFDMPPMQPTYDSD